MRDYSADHIVVLTLRESVVRRPWMYFGDCAAVDWPLVIAAWTAHDLLDYTAGPQPSVEVTLHRDGDLSAAVVEARVAWPLAARPAAADEVIRRRMWWSQLARSTVVSVQRGGAAPGEPDVVNDELVWRNLDVLVRLALDPDLIGVAPQRWWHDGIVRLQAVFATDHFRPAPGRSITIADETAGKTAQVSAA